MKLLYKLLRCRKRLSHLDYSLRVLKLELRFSDSKYYYFIDVNSNNGYRVSKIENGEILDVLKELH